MKIAVNLFLTSPKSVTGAFVYIENILPALFRADKENTFYLFGESESIDHFRSLYGRLPNVRFHAFGIKHDLCTNPIRATRKILAKVMRDYSTREALIAKEITEVLETEGIAIYFSPASLYPRGLDHVRIVTTIHDLQPEYFPENFPLKYLLERKEAGRYAVARSTRLIAISEYTKKSLIEKYGADPAAVSVVYHAPPELKEGPVDLETPSDFVFYPATLWPHKNHAVLISAVGILKDRFPSLHVVCTGSQKGNEVRRKLDALVKSEGLHGRVLFMGYVSGGNLRALYARARALVFPSAFEGFGLPLIEAFRFGLPVIAADNSSITEVVREAGILVETGNVKALAGAIEKVLTDDTLCEVLIRKGRERAKLFSWEKAAKETLEIFTRAVLDTEKGSVRHTHLD